MTILIANLVMFLMMSIEFRYGVKWVLVQTWELNYFGHEYMGLVTKVPVHI